MNPAAFDYHRATSLEHAAELLGSLGDEAKVLAGGHSLLPFMKLRFATPSALVDIGGVAGHDYVRLDGDVIRIGALTTHRSLSESTMLAEHLPLLRSAASSIGDPQIRARGTLGGSVAHADPAGELPMLCRLLDATIVTTAGSHSAAEFFQGRYTTPLADDELISEVVFPVAPQRGEYLKFSHRLYDWALVGVAAQRVGGDWRIGLVNVSDTPVRALAAEAALAGGASLHEAAALAAEGLRPAPSHRASADYELHLTRVLTRRVLEQASS